jgi:hypothetical protein
MTSGEGDRDGDAFAILQRRLKNAAESGGHAERVLGPHSGCQGRDLRIGARGLVEAVEADLTMHQRQSGGEKDAELGVDGGGGACLRGAGSTSMRCTLPTTMVRLAMVCHAPPSLSRRSSAASI